MYISIKSAKEFVCLDCHVCTFCINEYYMVYRRIWKKINPKINGMLCIGCVEKRLGRKLNTKDFTKCSLNKDILSGELLSSRRLVKRINTLETK